MHTYGTTVDTYAAFMTVLINGTFFHIVLART
jgi:hypothetical protein